jgi:hypothetical protein
MDFFELSQLDMNTRAATACNGVFITDKLKVGTACICIIPAGSLLKSAIIDRW